MDPSTSTDPLKKRKLNQNAVVSPPTLTSSDILKLIEPFTHQQLSEIVATASLRHPDVLAFVRAIADEDLTQRYILIKGLDLKTTSASLRSVFATYGEIEEAMVTLNQNGKSKGYGYVIYKHVDSALLALKQPSKLIDGTMTVTMLNSCYDRVADKADAKDRTVLVRDVTNDMSNEKLLECFEKFGEIETGPSLCKSDGNVVIVYKNVESAKASIVDYVKYIDGRKVRCRFANDNKVAECSRDSDVHKGMTKATPKRQVKETGGVGNKCKVYIGNVPYDITKQKLLDFFKVFGEVKEGPFPTDKVTGKFRGFAFIIYKDVEGADACLAERRKSINGHFVYCDRDSEYKKVKTVRAEGIKLKPEAKGTSELYRKVCIRNVPYDMTKERLFDCFKVYGEVKRGPFGMDRDTGKFSKGSAFVVYENVEGADACLVDPKKNVDGHGLYCERASESKRLDDGFRPDQSLMHGSSGSQFGDGGPIGVSAYGGISGELGARGGPDGISGYGGGGQRSPIRYSSQHLLNMNNESGLSPLGSIGEYAGRGAIYGGMVGDPVTSFDRMSDGEARSGANFGGRGATYCGMGCDPVASYDRTSDGEVRLGANYGGRGANYGGMGDDPVASYDRMTSDREAWLGTSFDGRGASYGGMSSGQDVGLSTGYGGSGQRSRYAVSPRSEREISGGYPNAKSAHYNGSGQRSRYVMSPRSVRESSGGYPYPEGAHYSLSSGSPDQNQQRKYERTTYKL